MNKFDRQFWQRLLVVTKPYWFSQEKWGARGLVTVLVLLSLAVNGVNVLMSFFERDFMTALSSKEAEKFFHIFFVYAGVLILSTPIVVFYSYATQKLSLYWRRWLTNHFLKQYFNNRAFYQINSNSTIDNPDERISQDVNSFTSTAVSYLLTIIDSVVTLISFIGILCSISTTLAICCILYSLLGTLITVWFGKRLIRLNFNQLKREADLRYKLVNIRDNAEMIAFFGGEGQELLQVRRRFNHALKNFNFLIGWQRNLSFFTTGYNYFIALIPSVVIAPLYFAGKVEFGVVGQADMAFSQVLSALTVIVSEFQDQCAYCCRCIE